MKYSDFQTLVYKASASQEYKDQVTSGSIDSDIQRRVGIILGPQGSERAMGVRGELLADVAGEKLATLPESIASSIEVICYVLGNELGNKIAAKMEGIETHYRPMKSEIAAGKYERPEGTDLLEALDDFANHRMEAVKTLSETVRNTKGPVTVNSTLAEIMDGRRQDPMGALDVRGSIHDRPDSKIFGLAEVELINQAWLADMKAFNETIKTEPKARQVELFIERLGQSMESPIRVRSDVDAALEATPIPILLVVSNLPYPPKTSVTTELDVALPAYKNDMLPLLQGVLQGVAKGVIQPEGLSAAYQNVDNLHKGENGARGLGHFSNADIIQEAVAGFLSTNIGIDRSRMADFAPERKASIDLGVTSQDVMQADHRIAEKIEQVLNDKVAGKA